MKATLHIDLRVVQCFAACFLLLTMISCKEEWGVTPALQASGVIMPMKVGNQWVYKTTEFDSTGLMLSTRFDTVKIVRDTLILTEKWYYDNSGILQTNRTDGRWIVSGTPYLIEKFPANVNETYPIMDTTAGITARIATTDQAVSVPCGSFSVVTYRWTRGLNANPIGGFSYAPNTGLVKTELYARSSAGVYVSSRRELLTAVIN